MVVIAYLTVLQQDQEILPAGSLRKLPVGQEEEPVQVTPTTLLLITLPAGSLRKLPVEVEGVLVQAGITERVVVNAVVRLRQVVMVLVGQGYIGMVVHA